MRIVLYSIWILSGSQALAATHVSDGTRDDVQAKIDAAADGDIVTIPADTFTWTSGVTVSGKGIHIQGAGGGRLEGSSVTSLSIGTGSKSFAIDKGTNGASEVLSSVIVGFTVGETVRAIYKARGTQYMQGTVTAYDGDTLTINVTSTGGSGTYAAWNFAVPASTVIVANSGSSTLFAITEDSTHSVELSGLHIQSGTGSGPLVDVSGSGKPFLWHDGRVSNPSGVRIIYISSGSNKGVLWNLYWDTGFVSGGSSTIPGYGLKMTHPTDDSPWNETSYMGTADTDGIKNVYVEDCFFSGLQSECFDPDNSARLVIRKCVFDNSGMASHGADTGIIGQRHTQIYRNLWLFNDLGSDTAAMNYAFYVRGGTGVLVGNVIPDINSSAYPGKSEITLTVQNLQRNAGPNPLWGKNVSGVQYHAPRQVGFGYVTGLGTTNGITHDPPGIYSVEAYVGDSEPWYQWNNAGAGNYASPLIENFATPGAGEDDVADYIQVGRDWINGTKSGWTAYTYPHPLREESPAPSGGVQVTNLSVGTFAVP